MIRLSLNKKEQAGTIKHEQMLAEAAEDEQGSEASIATLVDAKAEEEEVGAEQSGYLTKSEPPSPLTDIAE